MTEEYFISIALDKRRKLKSEKYPVRLRVYIPGSYSKDGHKRLPGTQKLYATTFDFTEDQFKKVWQTLDVEKEFRAANRALRGLVDKAEDVAKDLDPFMFEEFEKKFYQRPGETENVFYRYEDAVKKYNTNNQIGTGKSYGLSQKSIKAFLTDWKGKEPESLLFREINQEWLNRYERYMTGLGRSQTTVGIYLRPLRALFKSAIADGTIKQENYPFGRKKYEIPQSEKVKKALSALELKKLYEVKPGNIFQEKAKDYWFFLFNTAGINIKDLLRLKYINMRGEKLVYVREKTKRTTKAKLRPVVVYLNDYAKQFIEKYGNPEIKPQNYIFNIFKDGMSEEEKFDKAGAFTRTLNQHLKKLCEDNGLPKEISSYWSRHSFATNAIRGGASMEQIQQALNHANLTTTQNYFAGFEDDSMKQLTKNLMNF